MFLICIKIKVPYEAVCPKVFQYETKGFSNLLILWVVYLKHQLVSVCDHMGELFTKNHHSLIDLMKFNQKN